MQFEKGAQHAPVTQEPPPSYEEGSTGVTMPPSYSRAIDPAQNQPISEQYDLPVLQEGQEWGSYIPEGKAVMVVPTFVENSWTWQPKEYTDYDLAKMEAIERLSRVNQFRVVEAIQFLQSVTQGCIVEPNTYVIYDGLSNAPLFVVKEQSDTCTRCCMAPNHAYKLRIYLADHYGYPLYKPGALYTIDRDGGDCKGCGNAPCYICPCSCRKWLSCCNIRDCARNEMIVYQGDAEGYPHLAKEQPILARAKESSCCSEGWCLTPNISLFSGNNSEPYAIAEGPSMFGGFLNCCVTSEVPVSKIENMERHKAVCTQPLATGDLAMVKKLHPTTCMGWCREMCTDSDIYTIDVTDPTSSIETRVSIMASIFLLDSMLFEREAKPIQYKDGGLQITCWECYVSGCILPCCLYVPLNQNGN